MVGRATSAERAQEVFADGLLTAMLFWPGIVAIGVLGPAALALRPALSLLFIAGLLVAIGVGVRGVLVIRPHPAPLSGAAPAPAQASA